MPPSPARATSTRSGVAGLHADGGGLEQGEVFQADRVLHTATPH
jgi:hypothetical protein